MIGPLNPNTGHGWKNNYTDNTLCDQRNETGEHFFEYIKENAFSFNETFLSYHDYFQEHPKLFYVSGCFGLYFQFKYHVSLKLSESYEHGLGHTLHLNPEMDYAVFLTDPKLKIFAAAPDIFPRTLIKLKPRGGIKILFLKVQ